MRRALKKTPIMRHSANGDKRLAKNSAGSTSRASRYIPSMRSVPYSGGARPRVRR